MSLRHSLSAAATKAFFTPRSFACIPSVAVWQTLDELLSAGSSLLPHPFPFVTIQLLKHVTLWTDIIFELQRTSWQYTYVRVLHIYNERKRPEKEMSDDGVEVERQILFSIPSINITPNTSSPLFRLFTNFVCIHWKSLCPLHCSVPWCTSQPCGKHNCDDGIDRGRFTRKYTVTRVWSSFHIFLLWDETGGLLEVSSYLPHQDYTDCVSIFANITTYIRIRWEFTNVAKRTEIEAETAINI